MLAAAAHFPDAVVRLAPDRVEMLEHCALHAQPAPSGAKPAAPGLMQRVHHFAEDVELKLVVRRVADAHRPRILVAGQPGDLPFGQPPLAGERRT